MATFTLEKMSIIVMTLMKKRKGNQQQKKLFFTKPTRRRFTINGCMKRNETTTRTTTRPTSRNFGLFLLLLLLLLLVLCTEASSSDSNNIRRSSSPSISSSSSASSSSSSSSSSLMIHHLDDDEEGESFGSDQQQQQKRRKMMVEDDSGDDEQQSQENKSFIQGCDDCYEPACWILSYTSSTSNDPMSSSSSSQQQQHQHDDKNQNGDKNQTSDKIGFITASNTGEQRSKTTTLLDHCQEGVQLDVSVDESCYRRIQWPDGSFSVLENEYFEVTVSASGWLQQQQQQQHRTLASNRTKTRGALVLKLCKFGAVGCNPIAPQINGEIASADDILMNDDDGSGTKEVIPIEDFDTLDKIENLKIRIGGTTQRVKPGAYTFLAYLLLYESTAQEGDDEGGGASVSKLYAISNIPRVAKNRIVTFSSIEDAAEVSDKARYAVIGLSACSLLLLGILFLAVLSKLKTQVFQLTQGKFILAMQLCGMIATSCLFLLNPLEDIFCTLQQPLIVLPLHLMYAIILGRMWRIRAVISPLLLLTLEKKEHWTTKAVNMISHLTNNETWCCGVCDRIKRYVERRQQERDSQHQSRDDRHRKKIRRTITDLQLARVILFISVPQLILQILMLVLHDNKKEIQTSPEFPNGIWECKYSIYNSAMELIAALMVACLFILIVVLARASKELPSLFNETKAILDIAWTSLSFISAGLLLAVTTRTTENTEDFRFLVTAYTIGITTVYACFKLTLPKLKVAWSGKQVLVTKLIADHNFQRTERKTGNKYYNASTGNNQNYNYNATNVHNNNNMPQQQGYTPNLSDTADFLPSTYTTGSNSQYSGPIAAQAGMLHSELAAADLKGETSASFHSDTGKGVDPEGCDCDDDINDKFGEKIDTERAVAEEIEMEIEDTEGFDSDDNSDALSTDSSVVMEVRPIMGSISSSHQSTSSWNKFRSAVARMSTHTSKSAHTTSRRDITDSSKHKNPNGSDVGLSRQLPNINNSVPVRISDGLATNLNTALTTHRAGRKLQTLARNTLLKTKGMKSHRNLFDVGSGHNPPRRQHESTSTHPSARSFDYLTSNSNGNGAGQPTQPDGANNFAPGRASMFRVGRQSRFSMFAGFGSGGRGSAQSQTSGLETTITYNKKYTGRPQKIFVSETEPPGRRLLLRMIDVQRTLLKVNDALMTGLCVDRDDWESLRESCIDLGDAFQNEVVFAWEPHQPHPHDDEVIQEEYGGGGDYGARKKKRPMAVSQSVSLNPELQPEHIQHDRQQRGRKSGGLFSLMPGVGLRQVPQSPKNGGNSPGRERIKLKPRRGNGRSSLPFGLNLGKGFRTTSKDDPKKNSGGTDEKRDIEKRVSESINTAPPPSGLFSYHSAGHSLDETEAPPTGSPLRNSLPEYLSTVNECDANVSGSERSNLGEASLSTLSRTNSAGIPSLKSIGREVSSRSLASDIIPPPPNPTSSVKSVTFQDDARPLSQKQNMQNQDVSTQQNWDTPPARGVRNLPPVLKNSPIRPESDSGTSITGPPPPRWGGAARQNLLDEE